MLLEGLGGLVGVDGDLLHHDLLQIRVMEGENDLRVKWQTWLKSE